MRCPCRSGAAHRLRQTRRRGSSGVAPLPGRARGRRAGGSAWDGLLSESGEDGPGERSPCRFGDGRVVVEVGADPQHDAVVTRERSELVLAAGDSVATGRVADPVQRLQAEPDGAVELLVLPGTRAVELDVDAD